tara:strand:- start:279 stop:557 length:279 start_codon:yes stop_codon:yes gene_type:complete
MCISEFCEARAFSIGVNPWLKKDVAHFVRLSIRRAAGHFVFAPNVLCALQRAAQASRCNHQRPPLRSPIQLIDVEKQHHYILRILENVWIGP